MMNLYLQYYGMVLVSPQHKTDEYKLEQWDQGAESCFMNID